MARARKHKKTIDTTNAANIPVTERTYRAAYRLLNRVSPVDYDCGKLCGAACCMEIPSENSEPEWGFPDADLATDDEDAYGIYLMPGEDAIHDRDADWLQWSEAQAEDYEFPDSWSGSVYFVRCKEPPHCNREMRPLQCRTFPLLPHITEDGELIVIYDDTEVPYVCPLIEEEIPLNDDFVKATHTVWKHLCRDRRIWDLVKMDSEARY